MNAFALSMNKRMDQRHDDLARMYDKGLKTMPRRIDSSISNVVSAINLKVNKAN